MIDRKIAPQLKITEKLNLIEPHIFDVEINTKLYHVKEVPNDTCRLDLFFNAGTGLSEYGIASMTNALLLSGTSEKTATEISEELDSLGAYLDHSVGLESASLSVYCLRDKLTEVANLIKTYIQKADYPESEYLELQADRKQNFLIGNEKVSTLAQRFFQERLFHSHVNYSSVPQLEWFEVNRLSEIKQFYKKHYLHGLTKIVVVGNIPQDDVDSLIDLFGSWSCEDIPSFEKDFKHLADKIHIEKENSLQSAIRLGRIMFNKTHEDFLDFSILQTILADYFGSRLMRNIREDKGFTYGVGSALVELKNSGYFVIATEVGKEFKDAAITEIKREFEIIQNELVSAEELALVKNYLLGQLLKSADGAYNLMDLFLNADAHDMDFDFYNKTIKSILAISPQRIQDLARQYLNWDDFTIVSVG